MQDDLIFAIAEMEEGTSQQIVMLGNTFQCPLVEKYAQPIMEAMKPAPHPPAVVTPVVPPKEATKENAPLYTSSVPWYVRYEIMDV